MKGGFRGYSLMGLARAAEARRNPALVPSAAGISALFKDVGPRPRTCRWIEGEPAGLATVYCGAPRDDDPSYTGCYCPAHRERARGKPAAVVVHHHRSKAGAML